MIREHIEKIGTLRFEVEETVANLQATVAERDQTIANLNATIAVLNATIDSMFSKGEVDQMIQDACPGNSEYKGNSQNEMNQNRNKKGKK